MRIRNLPSVPYIYTHFYVHKVERTVPRHLKICWQSSIENTSEWNSMVPLWGTSQLYFWAHWAKYIQTLVCICRQTATEADSLCVMKLLCFPHIKAFLIVACHDLTGTGSWADNQPFSIPLELMHNFLIAQSRIFSIGYTNLWLRNQRSLSPILGNSS